MIRALSLSIAQLTDPAILRVLAKSLAITLLLIGLLAYALSFGASAVIDWFNGTPVDGGVAGLADDVLGAILAVLLFVFGFRIIAIPVINIFADEIVAAVEAKHYPQAASTAQPVSLGTAISMGAGSVGRLLLANLAALPVYILLIVTGVGTVLAFALVNALLLGRDLGDMVAVRHLTTEDRHRWLRSTRGQRLVLGGIATGLFFIPLLNLLAPVIGAAMATHFFHASITKGRRT
jgi:CysZ protein